MLVLASDFDGTLLRHSEEGPFLKCDIEAIRSFQKENNLFGVCTGRPLHSILEATSGITYDFYIVSSGAIVLDKEKKVLFERCLSQKLMRSLIEGYKDLCEIVVQADQKVYSFQTLTKMPTEQEVIASLDDLNNAHIYGVSMMTESEKKAEQLCRQLQQQFHEEIEVFQNLHYIDIVSKGCSKGHAMDILKQQFPESLLGGIGDSYNDVPMLEHADVAFTFHHSPKSVQQIADHLVSCVADAIYLMKDLSAKK